MSHADLHEGEEMKQEAFLPEDYTPAEDEPFMNDRQLEYFRRKLLTAPLNFAPGIGNASW